MHRITNRTQITSLFETYRLVAHTFAASTAEVAAEFGVTHQGAFKRLTRLEEAGLVVADMGRNLRTSQLCERGRGAENVWQAYTDLQAASQAELVARFADATDLNTDQVCVTLGLSRQARTAAARSAAALVAAAA